jgi:hypothetical protein
LRSDELVADVNVGDAVKISVLVVYRGICKGCFFNVIYASWPYLRFRICVIINDILKRAFPVIPPKISVKDFVFFGKTD